MARFVLVAEKHRAPVVIGVDTGGTFTDLVFRQGRRHGTLKLLSTPDDPSRAVLAGLDALLAGSAPTRVTYGTTVATNAMLQRRGVSTALLTTAGFEDVIEIGRQARPALYDLEPYKPAPLVPRRLRFGVAERVLYDGSVEVALADSDVDALLERLSRSNVASVAVCLLHAGANPEHERRLALALERLDIPVTTSHELSPEPGEYERTSTTVVNAYVRPIVARHLSTLARECRAETFRVMQSNAGAIGVETACREPIRTMLSGPAGGVSAAFALARREGLARAITFDMGGTSTDVSLIDEAMARRAVTMIGGLPVRTPSVDIHTVGAGGGSIASVDPAGSLKVGPESAGADPGPACYGRGARPTVTDANAVLGRLLPRAFLGGAMRLDVERAREALGRLARDMEAPSPEAAAEGVVRVVEGTMERAIRVITVERGQDARTCVLVAFGGAAGLHACGLARALAIPKVIVPADPGLFSAWGVLEGRVVRDVAVSLLVTEPAFSTLRPIAQRLSSTVAEQVVAEGIAAGRVRTEIFLRMRYAGQSLVLEIPFDRSWRRTFDHEHDRLFHTSSSDRKVEVVGMRATASGRDRDLVRRSAAGGPPPRSPKGADQPATGVYLDGAWRDVPIVDRDALPASGLLGPAIITEYSSTTLVAPGWRLRVDDARNLLLEATRAA